MADVAHCNIIIGAVLYESRAHCDVVSRHGEGSVAAHRDDGAWVASLIHVVGAHHIS